MWHDTGNALGVLPVSGDFQPWTHFENPETKRRLKNLMDAYGFTEKLQSIEPFSASVEQICRVHTAQYVERIKQLSADKGGNAGESAPFGPGSYEIALLAAGGVIAAGNAILDGDIKNAYALVRPCGHHAEADRGRGFCIFSNVAVAAKEFLLRDDINKIAVVDWDVHHGNGTVSAFYDDPSVLTISLHEDSLYPYNTGTINEKGEGAGEGFNINIPLPPGCGGGAYKQSFESIVIPALKLFKPDMILVANGLDASTWDPLGHMMLLSNHYCHMATELVSAAELLCDGRLLICHEGGYSAGYVPFCGIAIMEALSGEDSGVIDPFGKYENQWHDLQPNQQAAIDAARESSLELLGAKLNSAA
ncbi:MAG: class II histone deacetylase [Pseudomonadales bacterium]|nr:class II histone deacetylase [Pseudomonadales bacterium]